MRPITRVAALSALLAMWPSEQATGSGTLLFGSRDPVQDSTDWLVIRPEGDTGCAFGTPFQFFYHEVADPSRLMVYFQGGGACWEWVSCSGMFDRTVTDHELEGFGGIFDFDNAANPFRQYSIVFVPYCTGDVHVGDTVAQYGDASWNAPPVQHQGYDNVTAVINWIRSQVPRPERLVVAGASAGSYGALFHAPRLAAIFPSAELTVIADSGAPLLHEYPHILERWGAARALRTFWRSQLPQGEAGDTAVTLEAAHKHLARLRPDAAIAQITTDQDGVQTVFYIFSGSREWRRVMLTLLKSLDESISGFHAFVLSGGHHGLMRTDQFYTFEENGVRLRDWIDDLINRRPVTSQYCQRCDGADAR
jgi:hypothetical protein